MREKLRKAENALARVESTLLIVLIAVMVTLAFAQVVLRYLGHGLLWGETLLKQLVLWTGFLGAALAAQSEKHFAWEAANVGAPKSWRAPLRLLSSTVAAIICGFLFLAARRYTTDAYASHETLMTISSWSVPAWIAALGIPAGFALLIIHFVFKFLDAGLESLRL